MKTRDLKHPMQPIGFAEDGVLRFKKNEIIEFLVDSKQWDLDQIFLMVRNGMFCKEDAAQLMQLVGYSVSGYGELNVSPRESVYKADAIAEELSRNKEETEYGVCLMCGYHGCVHHDQ